MSEERCPCGSSWPCGCPDAKRVMEVCKCGHGHDAHYQYINNGKETTRCKRCDPWIKAGIRGGGVFEVIEGSEFHQRDKAADHPFEVSPAASN